MNKPIPVDFDGACEHLYDDASHAMDMLVETLNDCEMRDINFFVHADTLFVDASRAFHEEVRGVLHWNSEESTWEYTTSA